MGQVVITDWQAVGAGGARHAAAGQVVIKLGNSRLTRKGGGRDALAAALFSDRFKQKKASPGVWKNGKGIPPVFSLGRETVVKRKLFLRSCDRGAAVYLLHDEPSVHI